MVDDVGFRVEQLLDPFVALGLDNFLSKFFRQVLAGQFGWLAVVGVGDGVSVGLAANFGILIGL